MLKKCSTYVGREIVHEENKLKLLCITIDNQLTFDYHSKSMCEEAGKKINVLARITSYLNIDKRKLSMKSFFEKLLLKDNMVTIHTRNLKQLAKEIYKNTDQFYSWKIFLE